MCKKLIIAGHDDLKLIQEVHMGLGSIPNQSGKDLTMKYGQKAKRESVMSKKLEIVGYSHPNEFLARE